MSHPKPGETGRVLRHTPLPSRQAPTVPEPNAPEDQAGTAVTYANASEDYHGDVVVFAENPRADLRVVAPVAWRVIKGVAPLNVERFVYPTETTLRALWAVSDGARTYAELEMSDARGVYAVQRNASGFGLGRRDTAPAGEIRVLNGVEMGGGVAAALYKAGRLLMVQPHIPPGEAAEFRLDGLLYFGLVDDVTGGQRLPAHLLIRALTAVEVDRDVTVALRGSARDGYFIETVHAPRVA